MLSRKARSTPNVTSGSKKDAPSTPEKAPPQASNNEPSSPKSPVDPDVMDIITGVGGDDDPTLDGVDPKSLLNDEDAKLLESNANLGGSSSLVALGNISPEKKMIRSPSADSIETPPLSNTSGTVSGGGVKAASVSFALSSPSSPKSSSNKEKEDDENKTREELLETIGKVREEYSKMKIDYSAEKALRKKKERNLVKLAKQLNLRSTEIEEKNKMVDQLVKTSAELETKLDSTKRSLDTLTTQHTDTNRSHHTEITTAQNQYRDTCSKYDARIAELTSNHDRQCEELRRQILGISLEADRLRMQVASHEMRKNPQKAERVVARTLHESSMVQSRGLSSFRKRRDDSWDLKIIIIYGLVFLLTGGLAWAHTKKLLSIDAMCGPCMPGTELEDEPATFEAPWWVPPPSMKPKAFNMLCGSRPRTVLDWSVGPVGKTNRLVVTQIGSTGGDDDNSEVTPPPPLLDIKTKLKSVIVESGQDMSTTTMRGKVNEFQTPWMMMVTEVEEATS